MASAQNCGVCKKDASNKYVVIKDVRFHADCFKCKTCGMALGGKPYIRFEGDFLCQDDYYALQGNKCAHCEIIIKGQYVEAMDTTWCPDHFVCATCGQPFPDDQFFKYEGHPYCKRDYRILTSENCATCGEQILDGEMMEGGDQKYHMKCFVCAEDGKPIGDGDKYHDYNGKIYCDEHLKQTLSLTCTVCKKTIDGEYTMMGDKKMHKSCHKSASGGSGSSGGGSGGSGSKGVGSGGSGSGVPSGSGGSGSGGSGSGGGGSSGDGSSSSSSSSSPSDPVEEKKDDEDDKITTFFAYSSLTDVHNVPDGVNKAQREQYLPDGEFKKLFGCDKETFNKLPMWKKKAKKQKLNLW